MDKKSKNRPIDQPNKEKPSSRQLLELGLKQFVQYLQVAWKSVLATLRAASKRLLSILTGVSLVGSFFAYTVLWPSLSLTTIPTNYESALSAKFLLSNDGWLSVYNLRIKCTFTTTEYEHQYNGPKMDSYSNASSKDHVGVFKGGDKLSDSCNFSLLEHFPPLKGVSGETLTLEDILTHATNAHLSVSISFKPWFQWPTKQVQFPFKMDIDRKNIYWVPEPLEHYESTIKDYLSK